MPPLPTAWKQVPDADGILTNVYRAFQMRDYAAPLIARVAELEAENAKLRDADMFWNDADPEMAEGNIHDVIDREWGDGMLKHGDEMVIQQATRLPNIKVRLIPSADDGEDYFDYEIVDAALAAKEQQP